MKRQRARAQRRGAAGSRSSREITLPLPLRGLFVEAKSAQVSNLFAAELHNWRSNGVSLVLRPGVVWQGEPSGVIQRVPYEFGRNPRWIEITASGASCGAAEITRLFGGNAMVAEISSNIILADGFGAPVRFNGTEFQESTFSTVTGANPARFDGVISHHDRLYFWRSGDALEFYYGDVGAVQGGLSRFPLDRLGNITGSIAAMVSLTVDAGHGMNDMLCIVTTTGHLVLYEGLDPGDASDWRLSGRVRAAAPIGPLAFTEVGSDAWMMTAQGVVSIGESIRSSVLALVSDITAPISEEITAAVDEGTGVWRMFTSPDGAMVLISRAVGLEARQWVFYTKSKSWATADLPARDWHAFNGKPFITGFDGRLGTIASRDSGEMITARWVSSWFEAPGVSGVAYLVPTIRAQGPLTVKVTLLSDTRDSAADIAEAEQTVTLDPEEDDGGIVTLSDEIVTDAEGSRFQIIIEVTSAWSELISLKAAVV